MNGFLLLTAFVAVWWAVRIVIAKREERRFEAAYRRGDLFDRRREMMAAWADFCAGEVLDAKVIQLRRT